MPTSTASKSLGLSNKYDTIQVFRFIAALMVIILHSMYYTSERLAPGFPLYHRGSNGVRLFFVLSGFVMILSSMNLKDKIGGWKTFAQKRIIRIVPIYWLLTSYKLLVLIVASSLVYHAKIDVLYIVKSYFFIPAENVDGEIAPLLGVGWTLNFEMFFYLLFTLALAFRFNTVVSLAAVFVPLAFISIYKTDSWADALRFYANPIVLDFLYGMIAAVLILNGKKLPQTFAILAIIVGFIYLFFVGIPIPKVDALVIGLAALLVVYGGASIEPTFGPKMPAPLVWLGGASYSLYLIHPITAPLAPVVFKYLHLQQWPWLSVTCSIAIALTAGSVFYKLCEQPLTNLITKWSKKSKPTLVVQGAPKD